MNVHARPGHPNLSDHQPCEPLMLLEGKGVEALPDALGEGFEPACQPIVDRELMALPKQQLPLLFKLLVAGRHLVAALAELGEFGGLHLIEISHPLLLAGGVLKPPIEALELSRQ